MTPESVLAGVLALAVLVAWARLAWRQARAEVRAQPWRIWVLAALQPLCAGLLYLTLLPPVVRGGAGTLVVATAGTPRLARADVVLPEGPALRGAQRVPDLATALRRRPEVARVQVLGSGLEARDRDAVRTLAVAFETPAVPRGIVALEPPPPVAPGAGFRIGGRAAGADGGSVELLDPSGARVDRQTLAPTGGFVVGGMARAPGPALFRLRLRDRGNALIEEAEVPVLTVDEPAPRILLLAGAAGPEIKYLRRWANDAGLTMTARITAGGGAVLGDSPVGVDGASLARVDVAIIDERSWAGLGSSARAALAAAVRGGMGLVVRLTGPVPDATRREWRSLGLAVPAGSATAPAPLASGIPILTRRILPSRATAAPLWRDGRGQTLVDWRAVGRGRVALWGVSDAFTLVLTGHADLYGRTWSDVVTAVARPRGAARANIAALPRAGERAALCDVGPGASVDGPETAALLVDPAGGTCAGVWPRRSGWHRLIDRGTTPFYVYPADSLAALRATDRGAATVRLRRASPDRPIAGAAARRGSSWPWFAALLVALAASWWFERARLGKAAGGITVPSGLHAAESAPIQGR